MANLVNFLIQGGPMMFPLLGMSLGMTIASVKRGRMWSRFLKHQKQVTHDVLEAARYDFGKAAAIAEQAQSLPIGRFLLAPLKLRYPTPETFHLALEAAADREFAIMRQGDRQLEGISTVAPLFGLLGMVIALMHTFRDPALASTGVTTQRLMDAIGHGIIPVAISLDVEIISLGLLRLFSGLQAGQVEYFSEVGTKLELFYREAWQAAQRDERLKTLPDGISSNPSFRAERST